MVIEAMEQERFILASAGRGIHAAQSFQPRPLLTGMRRLRDKIYGAQQHV